MQNFGARAKLMRKGSFIGNFIILNCYKQCKIRVQCCIISLKEYLHNEATSLCFREALLYACFTYFKLKVRLKLGPEKFNPYSIYMFNLSADLERKELGAHFNNLRDENLLRRHLLESSVMIHQVIL